MSHVLHDTLERVTGLEINAIQRFAARDHNRALRLLSRQRRHGPASSSVSASQEQDERLAVLGGLETKVVSGSSVQVSAGQVLAYCASPVTETRPGTYSPVPAEADDDLFAVATLATATTVAPASPISGALASPEVWIVYGDLALVTVESDSARSEFNPSTGNFDHIDADKIQRWTVTPKVARVEGSAVFSTVSATLPANPAVLAVLYVPSGSTDLSSAIVFDARTLPDESPGPNMVGGHGQIGYVPAGLASTSTITAPASSTPIFRGHFWARYKGELLHATCGPDGLSALDIKSPNSSWDSGASASAPKLAWLYLARPGTQTTRPIARGTSVLGTGSTDRTFMAGQLVLSSTPPICGAKTSSAAHLTGGFYDLRPQSSITLPNLTAGGITYPFGGTQTSHALCLGPVVYTGYDSVNNCPVLAGPAQVSADGWIAWGCAPDILTGAVLYSALFDTMSTSIGGGGTVTATFAPKVLTDRPIPMTAARVQVVVRSTAGDLGANVLEVAPTWRLHEVQTPSDGSATQYTTADTCVEFGPQQTSRNVVVQPFISATVTNATPYASAIRWPFNEPLATLVAIGRDAAAEARFVSHCKARATHLALPVARLPLFCFLASDVRPRLRIFGPFECSDL